MSQPPVDATITIVSFNTREKLADCLQSVFDTTPGLRVEVIVIDNGSRDGSVEMVRERFPQVTVIATGQNLGFGRAHNLGMRQAGGRYLIVLNPDTLLLERTIQRQIEFMDSAPDAGACGCTVLDATRALAPSGHRDFTLLSLAANVFNLRAVLPRDEWLRRRAGRWLGRVHGAYHPHDAVRRVDWVDGACIVVRREVYDRVGGFDEGIFLNAEDFDWCYRMRQAGWHIYHVPDVALVHLMHQSKEQVYVPSFVSSYQSFLYLFHKHKGRPAYLALKAVMVAGFSWRLLLATLNARLSSREGASRNRDALAAALRMAATYDPARQASTSGW